LTELHGQLCYGIRNTNIRFQCHGLVLDAFYTHYPKRDQRHSQPED